MREHHRIIELDMYGMRAEIMAERHLASRKLIAAMAHHSNIIRHRIDAELEG